VEWFFKEREEKQYHEIFELVHCGGTIACEHGMGLVQKGVMGYHFDPVSIGLMRQRSSQYLIQIAS